MDIRKIADRINEYTKQLAAGTLNEIERDILLADLRELYILTKGETPAVVTEMRTTAPVVETPVKTEAAALVIEKIEPIVEAPVKPVIEFIQEPIVQKVQEAPKVEVTPIAEVQEIPVVKAEAPKEEPIQLETRRIHYHEGSPVRGPKPGSLNEVFTGEEKSLNTIAGGGDKKRALNDRVAGTDLNSLLDLNRKHVFTNELFGGDAQAFQAAIRNINDSPTIEAAFEYIKTDLLPKYQWRGDMQSAKLFDKLVRQKFGL